ncbi:Major facilitator superfamily domain, general substrate transporter [Akanthomyces lecanii RCEF 1005]|uniref:Major facilitator superfamily domain, general substrate transporter n=1 Tax=Akanthomyces lecanii RCEF 1005 TaxID=1081108 RepID=A0A168KIL3_CORDF|nr:Major facilitator superfamily domain, general substrate transporter [Akanthomyces lecanii RCEF 1005]
MDPTQQGPRRTENLATTVSSDVAACNISENLLSQAPEKGQTRNDDAGEDLIGKTSEMLQASSRQEGENRDGDQYSAYAVWQKRLIVSLGASVGWFSTSSSFIFFPIIPFLARDLRESTERINLTVTSYLVASGVFPSIVAGLSDVYGRKPVFVTALGAYVAVNIGLALQRSFAVLLGLRLLQAAAISASFAFSYGVLGDITTSTERGEYIGLMSIFLNTPASVAPLISGLLLIRWSWPATFWFLAIASGTVLLAIVFFFPETCRNVAGDGTRRTKWQHSVIIPWLKPPRSREPAKFFTADKDAKNIVARKMITPLDLFKIFRNRATTISIVCYGIFYAMYSCLQASLSTIFVDQYGVSGLTTGLLYLPFGIATIFASVLAGMLMDREYAKVAKRLGLDPDKRRQHDLTDFPIERVRLSLSKYAVVLCVPCIVGYGWALQHHTHMAVPLVLQFCIGFTNQVNFTTLNGLITDLHPDRSATVQAACNLFRCEFAAGMLALLDVMLRKLRPGWCFTVIAIMQAIAFPALWAVERNGLAWRKSGKQESIGKK